MIERDYYFGSWVIDKGVQYEFQNKQLHLFIDRDAYRELKKEYTNTVKPIFNRVHKIITRLKSEK